MAASVHLTRRLVQSVALATFVASAGGCVLCPLHYRASAALATNADDHPDTGSLPEALTTALQPLGYSQPAAPPAGANIAEGTLMYFPPTPDWKIWQVPNDVIVVLDIKARSVSLYQHYGHPTDYTKKVEQALTNQVREKYGASLNFVPHPTHECMGP